MTYRAIIARVLGPPESYAIETIARAPLCDRQVRVAIAAAGVSFVDVLIAGGDYQVRPPVPYVPATEFSGTIIEIGTNVSGYAVGDRVACAGIGGGFAEEAVVDTTRLIRLPDRLDFVAAASAYVSYQTAYHALIQRACLQAGETILVLGASGGVATATIELGRVHGATIIASASSGPKREVALLSGAGRVIDSMAEDWREQVRAATGGRGVDVIVDPVGGAETERAFRSLAWNGRHLVIGFAGGAIPTLKTNLVIVKGGALIGVDIRQFREREPTRAFANLTALNRLIEEGALKPRVEVVYPFEEYLTAMHRAVSREHIGRVVLEINGGRIY